MKEFYKKVKSSDYCLSIFDGTHDSPKYKSSGFPLVTSKCIVDTKIDASQAPLISKEDYDLVNKRSAVKQFDILISMIGVNAGIVGLIKEQPKYAIKNVGVFRCKSELDARYLFYYLQSAIGKYNLRSSMAGSAQPYISLEQLRTMLFYIPNDPLKQHIVNTIGTIDDFIENKEKEYASKINLLLSLFSSFESENKTSFGEAFKTYNGGTFQSKYYVSSSSNKLITIKNVDDKGFNTESVSFLDDEHADKRFLLNAGDIVLTMTGNIGRSGIVDETNCYLNQRVLKLDCDSKSYLLAYLIKYKNEIIQLGKGTAQLNLSLEDLKQLAVKNTISDIKEFKRYDSIFESLINTKLIIKKAKEIKQILLSKYF